MENKYDFQSRHEKHEQFERQPQEIKLSLSHSRHHAVNAFGCVVLATSKVCHSEHDTRARTHFNGIICTQLCGVSTVCCLCKWKMRLKKITTKNTIINPSERLSLRLH